jgi:transposase
MANASLDDCDQDGHQRSTYRRIELITGETQRRRWTAEEKARILADSFQPGAKVSEVALRHGVNRGLLWTWRRQARKHVADGQSAFVPVRIVDEATPKFSAAEPHEGAALAASARPKEARREPATGSIDIEIGDARVRVRGAVDAAALRQVLTHLGRR